MISGWKVPVCYLNRHRIRCNYEISIMNNKELLYSGTIIYNVYWMHGAPLILAVSDSSIAGMVEAGSPTGPLGTHARMPRCHSRLALRGGCTLLPREMRPSQHRTSRRKEGSGRGRAHHAHDHYPSFKHPLLTCALKNPGFPGFHSQRTGAPVARFDTCATP